MNNTKKCLIFSTGIALVIALCSSFQAVAMTSSNPTDQKEYVRERIVSLQKEIDALQKIAMLAQTAGDQSTIDSTNKKINTLTNRRDAYEIIFRNIVSGKRSYTKDEFAERIYDIMFKIK
jgi:hypothetical protein